MSHQQPATVDATFYAVVTPDWSRWKKDDDDRPVLEGARVERITQNRPQTVRNGAVVTRLTLRLDSAALLPLQPARVTDPQRAGLKRLQAAVENFGLGVEYERERILQILEDVDDFELYRDLIEAAE